MSQKKKEEPKTPRELPQWVVWRYEKREGQDKPTKMPYDPKNPSCRASATDPDTWATAQLANSVRKKDDFDGIGFVFTANDPFCGVDLDGCIDQNGNLEPWAAKIINKLDSYTEFSPSGYGIHVIVKAKLPEHGPFRKGSIEMYDRARYFTVTGNPFDSEPDVTINYRQDQIEKMREQIWPQKEETQHKKAPIDPIADDDEIVELARKSATGDKFSHLWHGSTSDHDGDQSTADLALCSMLAFYAGPDPERIDRLFRRSGLMRDKWDERRGVQTYGERTVGKALEGMTDFYTPRGEKEKESNRRLKVVRDPEQAPAPIIQSARDLMTRDLPPVKWVVQDILPEGVTLLAGKSKIRKSWLCMGLCVAVASGGVAFGKTQVERGSTLYLALEDNDRRIQRRLGKILASANCPDGFDYSTAFPRLDQGGDQHLVAWLESHPDARLIIIDTLAKIRPRGRQQSYQEDYEALEKVMEIANRYQVGFIVVHHTRKAEADDVIDEINATTGLMGGVDGFLVLKTRRGRPEATMFVEGREIEESRELNLRWDQNIHGWTIIDDDESGLITPERRLILDILGRAEGEAVRFSSLCAMLGKSKQATRDLLINLIEDKRVEKAGRGLYKLSTHEQVERDATIPADVAPLSQEELRDYWGPDQSRDSWTAAQVEEEEEGDPLDRDCIHEIPARNCYLCNPERRDTIRPA